MADLFFHTDIAWTGVGVAGQGRVEIGGDSVLYSAPTGMGAKGVGTSPEELLFAAVAACYSSTLKASSIVASIPSIDIRHSEGGMLKSTVT